MQHNIPIVICVMNNIGWLCIPDLQNIQNNPPDENKQEDRSFATMFLQGDTRGIAGSAPYDVDFASLAKVFQAFGATVREPKEIKPALEAAFASGKPAVHNIYVDLETVPPMSGWWALPTPEYRLRKLKR